MASIPVYFDDISSNDGSSSDEQLRVASNAYDAIGNSDSESGCEAPAESSVLPLPRRAAAPSELCPRTWSHREVAAFVRAQAGLAEVAIDALCREAPWRERTLPANGAQTRTPGELLLALTERSLCDHFLGIPGWDSERIKSFVVDTGANVDENFWRDLNEDDPAGNFCVLVVDGKGETFGAYGGDDYFLAEAGQETVGRALVEAAAAAQAAAVEEAKRAMAVLGPALRELDQNDPTSRAGQQRWAREYIRGLKPKLDALHEELGLLPEELQGERFGVWSGAAFLAWLRGGAKGAHGDIVADLLVRIQPGMVENTSSDNAFGDLMLDADYMRHMLELEKTRLQGRQTKGAEGGEGEADDGELEAFADATDELRNLLGQLQQRDLWLAMLESIPVNRRASLLKQRSHDSYFGNGGSDSKEGVDSVAVDKASSPTLPSPVSRLAVSSPEPREYPFNAQFQDILAQVSDDKIIKEVKTFIKLGRLADDFKAMALQFGPTIIEERHRPDADKTIKPAKYLGGHAGGDKFVVDPPGLLFKFASKIDRTNGRRIYYDDRLAAKEASHQLLSLAALHVSQGFSGDLALPLGLTIDYLGFRLFVQTLIPIESESFCYGSADAGTHMCKESVNTKDVFELFNVRLAGVLNLKSHHVKGRGDVIHPKMSMPADLEGHKSRADGRTYALDFARLFPCEPASQPFRGGVQLVRLLRPELVRESALPGSGELRPLSPDANTKFTAGCPDAQENIREVAEVFDDLCGRIIPEFAAFLDSQHLGEQSQSKLDVPSGKWGSAVLVYRNAIRQASLDEDGSEEKGDDGSASPVANIRDDAYRVLVRNESLLCLKSDPTGCCAMDALEGNGLNLPADGAAVATLLHGSKLVELAHERGINVRHLERVRQLCTNDEAKCAIRIEQVARCVKHYLRGRWREVASVDPRSEGVGGAYAAAGGGSVGGVSGSGGGVGGGKDNGGSLNHDGVGRVKELARGIATQCLNMLFARDYSGGDRSLESVVREFLADVCPFSIPAAAAGGARAGFDDAQLQEYYRSYPFPTEREIAALPRGPLLRRVCVRCGISLAETAADKIVQLVSEDAGVEPPCFFTPADIAQLVPKVKELPLSNYAHGTAYFVRARKERDNQVLRDELAHLSLTRFKNALSVWPGDFTSMCNLGYLHTEFLSGDAKAEALYRNAIKVCKPRGHARSMYYLAMLLKSKGRCLKKLRENEWPEADELFHNALKINPKFHNCAHTYATFLDRQLKLKDRAIGVCKTYRTCNGMQFDMEIERSRLEQAVFLALAITAVNRKTGSGGGGGGGGGGGNGKKKGGDLAPALPLNEDAKVNKALESVMSTHKALVGSFGEHYCQPQMEVAYFHAKCCNFPVAASSIVTRREHLGRAIQAARKSDHTWETSRLAVDGLGGAAGGASITAETVSMMVLKVMAAAMELEEWDWAEQCGNLALVRYGKNVEAMLCLAEVIQRKIHGFKEGDRKASEAGGGDALPLEVAGAAERLLRRACDVAHSAAGNEEVGRGVAGAGVAGARGAGGVGIGGGGGGEAAANVGEKKSLDGGDDDYDDAVAPLFGRQFGSDLRISSTMPEMSDSSNRRSSSSSISSSGDITRGGSDDLSSLRVLTLRLETSPGSLKAKTPSERCSVVPPHTYRCLAEFYHRQGNIAEAQRWFISMKEEIESEYPEEAQKARSKTEKIAIKKCTKAHVSFCKAEGIDPDTALPAHLVEEKKASDARLVARAAAAEAAAAANKLRLASEGGGVQEEEGKEGGAAVMPMCDDY